jgi:hypothetical protein
MDRLFSRDDARTGLFFASRLLFLGVGGQLKACLPSDTWRGDVGNSTSRSRLLLLGRLNGPMVVAMIAMRMMQPSVHEVIDVVAVRDGFVTAPRAVRMPRTSHVRRALRRVCLADRQHMLIDVVVMRVVQVAVVQIVDVPIVADRGMPAVRVMLVMVIGVVRFVAGGHGFLLHGLTTFVRIGHRRSAACLIALCTRSRTWASATA